MATTLAGRDSARQKSSSLFVAGAPSRHLPLACLYPRSRVPEPSVLTNPIELDPQRAKAPVIEDVKLFSSLPMLLTRPLTFSFARSFSGISGYGTDVAHITGRVASDILRAFVQLKARASTHRVRPSSTLCPLVPLFYSFSLRRPTAGASQSVRQPLDCHAGRG